MLKRTLSYVVIALAMAAITVLSGCTTVHERTLPDPAMDQVLSNVPVAQKIEAGPFTFIDEVIVPDLQQLLSADLIVEGVITNKQTHWVTDTTATNLELADRRARGLPTGTNVLEYQVAIDKVLNGPAPSATIAVAPINATYEIGDHVLLFLHDLSGEALQTLGKTKYAILTSSGQFLIEKDNTLSSFEINGINPMVDAYRGKDKSILEKDIQDLVAKLPKSNKADVLENTLKSTGIVIEGTIQGVSDVHFVNSLEKSQKEIDQLLAEGKLPGSVLTDYAVTVDKVLYDMRGDNPRFFPDWKPLEPGQTIIVTRQGGTYKGVTKIEEAGPAFEKGNQEVLFLSNFSLANYDLPDDGQARYSTDSRLGRLLIGKDSTLTALTTQGIGSLFNGQSVEQLEKDLSEFLKNNRSNQVEVAPQQP